MQSDSIKNIATALIKAQMELENPEKNQKGYGYKYADLASIIDQTKPVLQKHGLVVTQLATDDGNGRVGVETILMHDSGEFLTSKLTLPIPDMKGANSTQAAGASITYARRYALSAILNINADEDTDASNKNGSQKAPVFTQPNNTNKISDAQVRKIAIMLKERGEDYKDDIYRDYNVSTIKDLTMAQASQVIKWLEPKTKTTVQ